MGLRTLSHRSGRTNPIARRIKMGSVMFTSRKVSEFKSRRAPIRSLRFALGLTILFCELVAVQGAIARATGQNGNAQDTSQAPAQNNGANTSDNGVQGTGQNGRSEGSARPGTSTSPVTPSRSEEH